MHKTLYNISGERGRGGGASAPLAHAGGRPLLLRLLCSTSVGRAEILTKLTFRKGILGLGLPEF